MEDLLTKKSKKVKSIKMEKFMKLASKPINHGSIEVHDGKGSLVQCDLLQRSKLMKHDRFIDHSTLSLLEQCTQAEFRILMLMYKISGKNGFIADKAIETDITRQTKAIALKSLCEKDLIRKAIHAKGVRTFIKGWLVNPFHFRKTRQTEEYFKLLETYNSFQDEDVILITMREYDQVMKEGDELIEQLKENKGEFNA